MHDKFPEIKEKIAKAEEFTDYIPQVDAMGEKLIALNDKLPTLKERSQHHFDLARENPRDPKCRQTIEDDR